MVSLAVITTCVSARGSLFGLAFGAVAIVLTALLAFGQQLAFCLLGLAALTILFSALIAHREQVIVILGIALFVVVG